MNLQRTIRKANAILATYGSAQPNIPYLAWCFSEPDKYDHIAPPLWFISHQLDDEGNPSYDYICGCGMNKTIHAPTCGSMIIPRIRFEKVKSAPTIESCWVLCRWIPPPSEADWMEMYNSLENYPRTGRYIPLTSNAKTITIPEDSPLLDRLSELSEYALKMHREYDEKKHEIQAEAERKSDLLNWRQPRLPNGLPDINERAPAGSKFAGFKDKFKDQMTQFNQAPGKKQHVSWGGLGTNPNQRHHSPEPRIVLARD